jgi:hypothetical protein
VQYQWVEAWMLMEVVEKLGKKGRKKEHGGECYLGAEMMASLHLRPL